METFERDYAFAADFKPTNYVPEAERATFQGFLRQDGRAATRNYLGVLTSVNCSATAAKLIVAYEPVWAIGTGKTPTTPEGAAAHAHIRTVLTGMMADAAAGTRAQTEDFEKRRVRDTVNVLLASVSEEDRILLTLKEVEGLSLKELEKIYNVNENALKVRFGGGE